MYNNSYKYRIFFKSFIIFFKLGQFALDIIDYKINIYECKNKHKIENILLNEFEETQNIDRTNIICDRCKNNNKSISVNNI